MQTYVFHWTMQSLVTVDHIYPIELEIKDTTYTDRSASYLDQHLENEEESRLSTKLHDERKDFKFSLWTFHLIYTSIVKAQQHMHATMS